MTVVETVLVFIGIPAGIIAVLFLATYGRSLLHQPNRYRPGRSWDYPASWFVPHPETVTHAVHPNRDGSSTTTAVGGASGEW